MMRDRKAEKGKAEPAGKKDLEKIQTQQSRGQAAEASHFSPGVEKAGAVGTANSFIEIAVNVAL